LGQWPVAQAWGVSNMGAPNPVFRAWDVTGKSYRKFRIFNLVFSKMKGVSKWYLPVPNLYLALSLPPKMILS
jgi:hypothetical protein